MKLQVRVSLFILFAIAIGNNAQDSLGSIYITQPPPSRIVIPTNTQYLYDPSDYAYSVHGSYVINGNLVKQTSSALSQVSQSTPFKFSEKPLGGWDLSMPAIYLASTGKTNSFVLYWDFIQDRNHVPTMDSSRSLNIDLDENATCYDAVAVDAQTILIDCSVFDPASGNVTGNYFLRADIVTKEAPSSSNTLLPPANYSSQCQRKIAYYKLGSNSWIFRSITKSCYASQPANAAPVEVLAIQNYLNITLDALLNQLPTDFVAVEVSHLFGNIFLASPKSTTIYRVSRNLTDSYVNATYSQINIGAYPYAIKATLDIILDSSSLSLVVATNYTLYRIDWTQAESPLIVETIPYGFYSVNILTANSDSTSVWASQNFYYIMADNQALLTYLRKPQNTSFPYGYFTPVVDNNQNKNFTLGIPGIPLYLSVDISQDIFMLVTDQATAMFSSLTPVQNLSATTTSQNLSLSIAISTNDGNDTNFAYNQNISITSNLSDALIVPELTKKVYVFNSDNSKTYSVEGIYTMSDPSNFGSNGSIASAATVPRLQSLSIPASAANITANFIFRNPYKHRNVFYWLTQDDIGVVTLQGCYVNVDIACEDIANASIVSPITHAALGYNSQTQEITLIALITEADPRVLHLYDNNFQSVLSDSGAECSSLMTTQSNSRSIIYCVSENQIKGYTTEFTGSPVSFNINANSIGITNFAPEAAATSSRHNDILFVQQEKQIFVISVAFAPDYFEMLSTVTVYRDTPYTFTVSQDQLIVSQGQYIANYDLSNIRNPVLINNQLTTEPNTNSKSLTSSGSQYFTLATTSGNAYIFDINMPSIIAGYKFNCSNVMATVKNSDQSEVIFCQDPNSTITAWQFFETFLLNVTAKSELPSTSFSNYGCATYNLGSTPYQTCFNILQPSAMQVVATNSPTTAFDLSNLANSRTKSGNINDLFKGPLNGSFEIETTVPTESSLFQLNGPITYTSTSLGNINTTNLTSGVNYNNQIYLLGNDGSPVVYLFSGNAITDTYKLAFPTNDSTNYLCSDLFIYKNPSNKTTFIVSCSYFPTGAFSLVFQSVGDQTSSSVQLNLNYIVRARISSADDYLFVLGATEYDFVFYVFQINVTNPGAATPSYFNLNSVFKFEGRHSGQLVDFELVPQQSSGGYNAYLLLFLDGSFGIRSAQFGVFPGQTLGFLETINSHQISTSSAFANFSIPEPGVWTGITIKDASNFTQSSQMNLLLVQDYGMSYLVTYDFRNGFIQVLQTFYPCSEYLNMGPAQFLDGKLTLLVANASALVNRGQLYTPQMVVVSYPFDIKNMNPSEPIYNYGVFPTALFSMIMNRGSSDPSPIWTIDPNGHINKILPTYNFSLVFNGKDSNAIHSVWVNIKALGGLNSAATARFTLVLPAKPPRKINVWLIVIVSVLAIAIAIGFAVCCKKKRLAYGTLDGQYLTLSLAGEQHRPIFKDDDDDDDDEKK